MSQHNYTLISTVAFGLLALMWGSGTAFNSLIKLTLAVLAITGIFVLLGIS